MKLKFPIINLENVKGVLIDIDNTLYCYDNAHSVAIKRCYEAILQDDIKAFADFDDFYTQYRAKRTAIVTDLNGQGASRSRLFAFQYIFEQHTVQNCYVLALKYENIYWDSLINAMVLLPEAKEFLINCKDKNIPVCAVTDMQAYFQVRKLEKLQLVPYIQYMVSSEEVGIEKPDAKMFMAGLQKINQTTSDVIMIGDSQAKDIAGAESLGIKAYKVECIKC